MNYKKVYDSLIERAKLRKLEGYKEKHHIIPKCIGGNNSKENLVCLTAREHFICHWLLHNIYPESDKLLFAFQMMCNVKDKTQKRYIPSSRIIEYVKKEHSKRITGDKHPKYWLNKTRPDRKGKPLSDEHKKNISESRMGHEVSKETREKISKKNTGQITTEETKKKLSLASNTAWKNMSHETKKNRSEKISKKAKGRLATKEQRENRSKAMFEKPTYSKKIVQKSLDGVVIKMYDSIAQAGRETGLSRIIDFLKKRRKSKKFIWEYI